MEFLLFSFVFFLGILFLLGIRILRSMSRGFLEAFGKYKRFANPGFNCVILILDKMYKVNITEIMVDADPHEIITYDNLNARIDAQVLRKLQAVDNSLQYNARVLLSVNGELEVRLRFLLGKSFLHFSCKY